MSLPAIDLHLHMDRRGRALVTLDHLLATYTATRGANPQKMVADLQRTAAGL